MEQQQQITIKKEEVENFDEMSIDWWDLNGSARLLHSMNKLRVELVVDGLYQNNQITLEAKNSQEPLKGLKILDVGCGGGILTEALAELGATLIGIDPAKELLAIAAAHLSPKLQSSVKYLCCTVEELDASEHHSSYDAVVASEVLDHVNEWQFFLKNCLKCVQPNCSIFLSTINRTYFAWLVAIIFGEYILNFVPRGTHHYHNFIMPSEIIQVLESCEFKQCGDVRGSFYNPFTKSWSWSRIKSVTFAIHAIRLTAK